MNLIVYFVTLRSQVFRNGINYVKSFCNRIVSTFAADADAATASASVAEGAGSWEAEAEGIEFNWKVAHCSCCCICCCCCCCAKEQIEQVCGKCQRWIRFVWGIKVFSWFRHRPEAKIIGSLSDPPSLSYPPTPPRYTPLLPLWHILCPFRDTLNWPSIFCQRGNFVEKYSGYL